MNHIMKIEAVLFDLDGVLVDACDWHFHALNESLMEIAGFRISRKDHVEKFNGLPTAVKLKMLQLEPAIALRVEELKQKKTLEIIERDAKPMLEKIKLHSYLKNQGIKIACVTNSICKTATAMLQKTGQIDFIDLLVSNEDVAKNKPSPDCYNLAVAKFGVSPSFCICVEDSPKGIQAARSSCVPNLWTVSDTFDVTLENYLEITK